MDKQKQIEELTTDLCGIQTYAYMDIYPCRQKQSNEIVAEHLVRKGWIKPSDNAAVLTEFESFGAIEDLLTEFDEMGFTPTTLHPYPNAYASNWKLRLAWAIGQVRKETAEKFAAMAKQKAHPTYVNIDDNPRKDSFVLLSEIDEILKEFMEE